MNSSLGPQKKLLHKAFRRDHPLQFSKKPKTTFCVIFIMLKWIKFDYESEKRRRQAQQLPW